MITKFTLLFIGAMFYSSILIRANAQVNVQDSLALVDLYKSTDGPNWKNHTNWLNGPVTKWYGVFTGSSVDRIEEIWLSDNNLNGTIPASLGNLSSLQILSMSDNLLHGELPSTIGHVGFIYLNNNQLTGAIPSTFVNQGDLYLHYNQLSGNIPAELGNSRYLMWLYLDHNQLTGSIPATLGNLPSVEIISLGNNQLTGNIPKELGGAPFLWYIDLNHNKLNGTIPVELSNHNQVNLSNNQLSGPIPAGLDNIGILYLDSNLISGTIPPDLDSVSNLFIQHNQISGIIPTSLFNYEYFSKFDASDNLLTGDIPEEIGNAYYLSYLNLANNKLTGHVPKSISHSYALNYLNLSNNNLRGRIPSTFGIGTSLTSFNISHNKIWGRIPKSLSKLNLTALDLSHNRFGFDGMELIAETFPFAVYNKQKAIPIHLKEDILSVDAGGTLTNNTYYWSKMGGSDTTIIKGDSTFHPKESGVYRVKITNSIAKNLILKSDTITYIISAAAADNAFNSIVKAHTFTIYPNPAKDVINVTSSETSSFSLISQEGKVIVTSTINGKGVINVSSLAPGIYYIRNNKTGEMKKVVVTR